MSRNSVPKAEIIRTLNIFYTTYSNWRKNNKKDQNQNQLNRSESRSLLGKDSVSQESPAQRNHKLCTQTMKKMTMAGPRPNPGILGQILGHTQAGKT